MNIEMLRFIVELAGNGWSADADAFFEHYPKTSATLNELKALERRKLIRVNEASGRYFDIAINQNTKNSVK